MLLTALLAAATLVAHPIANESVLEPSVANEVEHALSRAPAAPVPPTPAAEAALAAMTNGLAPSALAVRLVSAQGADGRWVAGTNELTAAVLPVLRDLLGDGAPVPPPPEKPVLVAHRGACELTMPEASRPAFADAVTRGSQIVKLDLRETKDGVIVLSHDPTLTRTMGWNAKIANVTHAEILRHAFKPVGGHADERIVTLDEALEILRPVPEFWIDFKHYSPDFAERVLSAFARAGIGESRLMCATFAYPALAYLKERHPAIRRIAHMSYRPGDDMRERFLKMRDEYGLFGFNLPVGLNQTSADDVAFCHRHGLWISLWFVQTEARARELLGHGADAFVTDHGAKIRAVLK